MYCYDGEQTLHWLMPEAHFYASCLSGVQSERRSSLLMFPSFIHLRLVSFQVFLVSVKCVGVECRNIKTLTVFVNITAFFGLTVDLFVFASETAHILWNETIIFFELIR